MTWVAIDIALWGLITRYLNGVSGGGMDFVPALLGGVLMWDFCTRIMQGVSTAFLEDVWSRNFLNLFASPLSIGVLPAWMQWLSRALPPSCVFEGMRALLAAYFYQRVYRYAVRVSESLGKPQMLQIALNSASVPAYDLTTASC